MPTKKIARKAATRKRPASKAAKAAKTVKKAAQPRRQARALVVSLTHVDPRKYDGWDGRSGCTGCGIDAARISGALRLCDYQVHALADQAATSKAVLKALQQAAAETKPGETFFFFYTGHGGQMPDLNGDEEREAGGRPGSDETLVCYDAELIDDDLDKVWKSFPANSVIYMLSDSCNSGTNYRNRSSRGATPIRPVSRKVAAKMKASLLHIGGCRDSFSSYGQDDGGAFTKALLQAWDGGRGAASWEDLHEAVCAAIQGQIPQLNTYGARAASLKALPPLIPWKAAVIPDGSIEE